MDWIRSKHVRLCQNCLGIFMALLFLADVLSYWLCRWLVGVRSMPPYYLWLLLATVCLVSIPAWICLYRLCQLLLNIRMAEVFVEENVGYMLSISRCCLTAAVLTAASAFYYLPFLFVAIAALFMFLVVRLVAEAFREAIAMKNELDLTV